jgi:AraC-like DNA-binding protein
LVRVAIPLVRASVLQAAIAALERCGVPAERLLERASLSSQALQQPDTFVPFGAVTRFLELGSRSEHIEDLGLRLGQQLPDRLPGTFGHLVGQARTLQEALDTVQRLTPHHNSGVRAWRTIDGARVHLHHLFLDGDENDWGQFAAGVLMQYLKLLASVCGRDWQPLAVQVPMRRLAGCRDIPLLANVPIEFGRAPMTITISAALLDRPLPYAPPARTATIRDWELAKPADDVGGAVQQVVTALLPVQYPDIHLVAEAVGMSPRTLQRRLRLEGLTYADVVARTRCETACKLLGDPARKVIDVAFDLGYSDPAHFTRAFTRWTGQAPREFRRQAIGDAAPAVRLAGSASPSLHV